MDALIKWGLWGDEESLKEIVVILMLYPERNTDENLVVDVLADKGDQYKDMEAADVTAIWRRIKEEADDPRNPYLEYLGAMKDQEKWNSSMEIQDILRDLRRYRTRPTVATKQDLKDGASGEGGS